MFESTIINRRFSMSESKVILITGASSGNGQATAQLLAQQGYQVFGTSRTPTASEQALKYKILTLDVDSDESVAACVKSVLEQAGRIDVLVNNAGYEQGGALEEISLDEAHAQFETNFFGVVRTVKAVLPLMRKQKSGHIINISSLAGLAGAPFLGMYNASKFALEGYTEVLRQEVKPFQIQVSLIEVGFLNTPLKNKRQLATQPISEYDVWRTRAMNSIREYEEKGPDAGLIANTILKIIESKTPRLRYIVGQQAKQTMWFRWLLPEAMFEQGTRSSFNLDKVK
jgi:NAD(P)-dependent dehydrogenase (short-subunit alcohol dehydrogenase family)